MWSQWCPYYRGSTVHVRSSAMPHAIFSLFTSTRSNKSFVVHTYTRSRSKEVSAFTGCSRKKLTVPEHWLGNIFWLMVEEVICVTGLTIQLTLLTNDLYCVCVCDINLWHGNWTMELCAAHRRKIIAQNRVRVGEFTTYMYCTVQFY